VPPKTIDDAPAGWQGQAFNITLLSFDSASGANRTLYRINGGEWIVGSKILIDMHGNHTIEYYTIDNAGNIEPIKKTYAALDTSYPFIEIYSPLNGSTYYVDHVDLNYSVISQGSPINWTGYSLDGANVTLKGNITIKNLLDGPKSLLLCANNSLGRTSCVKSEFVVTLVDLRGDITISPASPFTGDQVLINVTIHNPRNADVSPIVNVYDNDTLIYTKSIDFVYPDFNISIQNLSYNPSNVTVHHGTRVVWTNNEEEVFTVTSDGFDSGDILPGGTWSKVFNRTGIYHYSSKYQPGVKGVVNVINRSKTISTIWIAKEGAHEIKISIDEANLIKEANETNNVASVHLNVFTRPDLKIVPTDIYIVPSNATAGDIVYIKVKVANVGGINATPIVQVKINNLPLDNKTIDVNAGSFNIVAFEWTPSNGTHIITAVADPDDVIKEDDETNNVAERQIGIFNKPDFYLMPSDIRISPEYPIENDQVLISPIVYNGGGIDGTAIVRLFIDGKEMHNDTLVIKANGFNSTLWNWNASSGIHTITVSVDSLDVVEGNESNNIASITINIPTRPDIVPIEIILEPEHPISGQPVHIYVLLNNTGQANGSVEIGLRIDDFITNATIFIQGKGNGIVNFTWTFDQGLHTIIIIADPRNVLAESNESNNNLSKSVQVFDIEDVVHVDLKDSVISFQDLLNISSTYLAMRYPSFILILRTLITQV
jgi:plastocyanin